jgi:hypothetical protein
MSLQRYLALMTIGTAICWLAWIFVIFNVDPQTAGLLGFLFFYFTIFFALIGTFSVIGFLVRRKMVGDDNVIFRHVKRTFRQSILISSAVVSLLLLLQKDLLTWWNGVLVIVFFFIVEGIIFTNRRYSNEDYVRKDL